MPDCSGVSLSRLAILKCTLYSHNALRNIGSICVRWVKDSIKMVLRHYRNNFWTQFTIQLFGIMHLKHSWRFSEYGHSLLKVEGLKEHPLEYFCVSNFLWRICILIKAIRLNSLRSICFQLLFRKTETNIEMLIKTLKRSLSHIFCASSTRF